MVAQDAVTAWDLKPNRENTNKVFNVLCNVQPVEHPWSGDWYARKIDVTTWSKDQFWFEKCKGLKRCKLYEYECNWDCVDLVVPEDADPGDEQASSKKRRNAALWANSNFTDVVVFWWYRIYMRKNDIIVNPYWTREKRNKYWNIYVEKWWDWDEDTCDHMDKKEYYWSDMKRPTEKLEQYPSDRTVTDKKLDDDKVNTFNTAWRIRLYIQQVDTKVCTWDTFDDPDEAPIVLVKEYEAAECNPDHFIMWYGWIWSPRIIDVDDWASIYMIRYGWHSFAFLAVEDTAIEKTDAVYVDQLWIYVTWLEKPEPTMQSILDEMWIDKNWYMIPDFSWLVSVWLKIPDTSDTEAVDYEETKITEPMHIYTEYWEIPYFATWEKLRAIHWFFSLKDWKGCNIPDDDEIYENLARWRDWEDETHPCEASEPTCMKKRIFIYDTVIAAATNTDVITWLTKRWARIAYVNASWWFYVSWNWQYIWVFWSDPTAYVTASWWVWDIARWYHRLPSWVTDVKTIWSSLLFLWPKVIYATANELTLAQWNFVSWTDNEDWYYSPWSYHNDDWEFLLARRWKVLWTLQIQISYNNAISLSFDPSTGFYINSHFKSLDNEIDKISIDANINYRYMSIYDNNVVWPHYSKLLIYDKHYNCRYRWMITWARIIHVKDNIFLWDYVYANKWRTWWWRNNDTEWWEIIEIISAYVWEEWLQTPKHIQYVKTALWDHSVITHDTLWDIDTSYWWRLYRRRNNITTTRYPSLLLNKNEDRVIETYEIGEEIYWHWKLLSHNLLNEISEYRDYDKFSKTIIREMWEESDMISELALFASIKEPINAPANVLELCISARHLDNVQFGSFYIWYYQLDADYEDIANTNVDVSDASDRTEEPETVINKWEYCEEILEGSACDVPPAGSF